MKKLGEGSYGRVYRSQRKGTGFALKINTASDEVSFLTAVREVDLLGHMKFSKYFIKLIGLIPHQRKFQLEAGYQIDRLALSFELAECNLQEYIDGSTKYVRTPERNDRYLIDLLIGLTQLHESGLIHRDIKPANVLLVNDQIKYCDFGLSKRCMEKMTPRMMIAEYRAPEIYQEEFYNTKADVWALGCLLIELLCNRELDSHPKNRNITTWLNWIKGSKWRPMITEMLVIDPLKRANCKSLLDKYYKLGPDPSRNKGPIDLELPVTIAIEPLTEAEKKMIDPLMKVFWQNDLYKDSSTSYALEPIRRNTIHLFRRYLEYATREGVREKRKLNPGATMIIWHPDSRLKRVQYDHRWRWCVCHYLAIKYFSEERHIASFDRFTQKKFTKHLPIIAEFEHLLVEKILEYKLWTNYELLPY